MLLLACSSPEPRFEQILIGTYTSSGSEGIYTSLLNVETGELTAPTLSAKAVNPSFLTIHTNESLDHTVFAVNEESDYGIDTSGAISTFAVHTLGTWGLVDQVSSRGASPCHISLDRSAKFVLVANYTGGTIAVYRRNENGMPGELTALIEHEGSGPDPKRQDRPHPHYIQTTPNNKFVLVADLGIDKVMIYRFDVNSGSLTPNDSPFASLAAGAGPRHLAMDATGMRIYVLNELNSTISFFLMDPMTGTLEMKQTVSALPPAFSGTNTGAEIALDAHGDVLYASNRGHDSIVMFAVKNDSGELEKPNWESTGKGPRHFALDLTGRWLLVANQYGNSVDVFEIDHGGMKLERATGAIEISSPVCIRIVGERH